MSKFVRQINKRKPKTSLNNFGSKNRKQSSLYKTITHFDRSISKLKKKKLRDLQPSKVVINESRPLYFGVNTYKGLYKRTNEDRISILLNGQSPRPKQEQPAKHVSMFSVFDGHGGQECCNFLQNNLHSTLLQQLDATKPIVS